MNWLKLMPACNWILFFFMCYPPVPLMFGG
jgi:hypothetical protein